MSIKGLGAAALTFIIVFTVLMVVGKAGQAVSREITSSDTYKKTKTYVGNVIDHFDHNDTVYVIQEEQK